MSYCFLSVGTVGAVRCVRTINSVKVFVEAYVTCNDAYTCAIPCAIVEVVSKNFESLLVVIAKYKISMCVSVSVPSFMSMYVCMYVCRQRAALGPLCCPQPTFRFEGHIGDIHVQWTTQAGELYTGHARVIIQLQQVIDPASI